MSVWSDASGPDQLGTLSEKFLSLNGGAIVTAARAVLLRHFQDQGGNFVISVRGGSLFIHSKNSASDSGRATQGSLSITRYRKRGEGANSLRGLNKNGAARGVRIRFISRRAASIPGQDLMPPVEAIAEGMQEEIQKQIQG